MKTISNTPQRSIRIRKLYRNLCTYGIIMLFLVFINYITSPQHWWVIWPAAGWGLGLILQVIYLFFPQEEEKD